MRKFSSFINFFKFFLRDTFKDRHLILQLAKRDFKNKYSGSFLGFVWSFVQPFIMVGVLWFVFSKGLKVQAVDPGLPFIVWLIPAVIAWDFFANTLNSVTNVFHEYSYLVKKIQFRISILPIVKIVSSAITHSFLLCVSMIILYVYGFTFSLYWLQILYYFFASFCLLLGMSWLIASLQVFVKDIAQITTILLQIGFWFTPIFWDFSLVPEQYRIFFKFNPVFYLVEGYRRSFVYNAPFWEASDLGMYFWFVTVSILVIGIVIFKKLKPHFADVL